MLLATFNSLNFRYMNKVTWESDRYLSCSSSANSYIRHHYAQRLKVEQTAQMLPQGWQSGQMLCGL